LKKMIALEDAGERMEAGMGHGCSQMHTDAGQASTGVMDFRREKVIGIACVTSRI